MKSVVLGTFVLLAVEACGGETRTAGSDGDAGPAMGDDAGSFTGFDGAGDFTCGALGEPCCAIVAQSQPIAGRDLVTAEGVGVTCTGGLACVAGVCKRPFSADGGDAGAKPGGEPDTGAPPGVHLSGPPTLAVGGDHSCVVRGGKLECWGANYAGELGIGGSTGPQASCTLVNVGCSPSPVAVTDLSAPALSVAAAGAETCVLLAGGTVACWGMNDLGQLGRGSASGPENCPGIGACATTPGVVSGVSGATAVATNGSEACAVLSSGAVECWGSNADGELGNTTVVTVSGNPVSFVPIMVAGLTRATAVALGTNFGCALLLDGTVECWGSNTSGQLGNGSTTDSTAPVHVSGVTGAAAIATGGSHSCALRADGTVVCWGGDDSGQLGLGTSSGPQTCGGNPCSTTPVQVPNLSGVTAIAAGDHDTCALLSDGTVRCWGWNIDGELGNGTTMDASTPVVVSGLSGASAIAVRGFSACALVSSGNVVCWGYNDEGQLGSAVTGPETCNTSPCSTTPRSVAGL